MRNEGWAVQSRGGVGGGGWSSQDIRLGAVVAASLCGVCLSGLGQAPVATNEPVRLPEVVVRGESEAAETVQSPFLPAVEGTRIHSGKKTSVLDLDELPQNINNNYRQALAKTPGLLLTEETTPLVSVGYRGLNPHRMQFTQVLKDGIPIHADPFGYPEAYYTPPLDTVDRIEFVRGGASLMYGPQPGGALNYVTHRPRQDRAVSGRTQHVLGSDGLYSTFSSLDGTVDRIGYYAGFNHRQSDGFRRANSDVDLYTGSAKLVLDAGEKSRWILNFDGYEEEHGEPGGLTFATAPGAVNYDVDREAISRPFDRFQLERYAGSLGWEWDASESTRVDAVAWGGYYSRASWRQRGGGFGTLPSGPAAASNTIELQEFYSSGVEGRLRHDWDWQGNVNTMAAGAQFFRVGSPRRDERGATPDAVSGALRNASDRETMYSPVFAENRFVFGDFSVTPGVRLENVWQEVQEQVNVDKAAAGVPLGGKDEHEFVPLMGLGLEYAWTPTLTSYGSLAEAYRPKIFTEAVPTGANSVIPRDLESGTSWQGEIGLRGQPRPFLFWDTSLFYLDFDNQIGAVATPGGTSLQNIGRTVHRGWEAAGEVELLGAWETLRDGTGEAGPHRVSLYANVMLLDAEIESSATAALVGNRPQYAPDHVFRAGAIYRWRERLKVAMTGTFVGAHHADDANSANFRIPSYSVWDLTVEWKVYRETLSVMGGVNNLFDEDYFSRIRGDGIDPAYGRNFYAGLSLAF